HTMLEQTTRIWIENLARAIDRRTFLKRTGQATFLAVAGLAAGHGLAGRAFAQRRTPYSSPQPAPPGTPDINCSPPGPYCNTGGGNLSGCHGAHCFEHLNGGQVRTCHVYYAYYPSGCWTSGSGTSAWFCCDCQCSDGSTCGCAQQNVSQPPQPDRPSGPVAN